MAGLHLGVGVALAVPDDLRPGRHDPAGLHLRHRAGHVDGGADAEPAGGGRDAQAVVSAGGRDHVARATTLRPPGEQRVQRPTDLEGARYLEELELEGDRAPVHRGAQHRSPPDVRAYALRRGPVVIGRHATLLGTRKQIWTWHL